jgi:two-component system, LuxR family, sensor kinase FixL
VTWNLSGVDTLDVHAVERAYFAPLPVARNGVLSRKDLMLMAIGVAAFYYAGALIGLWLTFAPSTTSVLWPPNAVLTSALLLFPVRTWWVCLAAALPVHVVLETNAGMSPPLVGLLFLTNCSEAILAAGTLRLVSDAPTRFDTLQRVAWFIALAALLAPIASSCADAAVVATLRGESYWEVWRARVFANTLTELSVVPAIILGLAAYGRHQWPSRVRLIESLALIGGLIMVATMVFGELQVVAAVPGPRTPTVLLLPLFFWAAVRFGVGGVSTAVLVSAMVASVSMALGHQPFNSLPPLEALLATQMYLTVMGMPLMCLAGLLSEKRRAAAELSERLRFEEVLAQISASFVRPVHEAHSAYDECLARIGDFLDADCVTTIATGSDGLLDRRLRKWQRQGGTPDVSGRMGVLFPWTMSQVGRGELVVFSSLRRLPPEATIDRDSYVAQNVEACTVVPFIVRGTVCGALAVGNSQLRAWRDITIVQIRLLAEVLANASAREEAELEVQRARHELAHVGRMVSMGELASSLAHELNQPLTGILSNAQAATRFLADEEPSLAELRAIVADIIDDDRRAGDVIKRMREMLTRSDPKVEVLEMNTLIRDVAVLITSDTIIRNVSITFDFAPEPAYVMGARIDLQQAVLNVLSNAMDAVAESKVAQRLIHVRVTSDENRDVRIVVRDAGDGFMPGTESRVFEPFFTTKPARMGMGLGVARSIVENQGGVITASNGVGGGAVITIVLPGVERRVA